MAETLRKVERAALASVAAPRAPAQPPLRLCVLRGDELVQLPGGAALGLTLGCARRPSGSR